VKIAGAIPAGYNVAAPVTIVDADAFTNPADSTLSTPVTGPIRARDQATLAAKNFLVMPRDVVTTMNADGSATIKFGANLPNTAANGWGAYALYRIRLKVADHRILSTRPREIDFTAGNSTEIRIGQTVVGATSGASGRVSKVTVQSGFREVAANPAVGTLTFYSVTGAFVNNQNLQVSGVTRAVSTNADSDADIDLSWFARNEWYRHVFYAVANLITDCSGSSTTPHFINTANLRTKGISCQPNDLLVCKSATGISGTD